MTGELADAYLEYIRVSCQKNNGKSLDRARRNSSFLLDGDFPRERIAEVVFDKDRLGWPLGMLGVDTVAGLRCREGAFGRKDVETLCNMCEGIPECAADVYEIRGMLLDGLTDEERFEKYTLGAHEMRLQTHMSDLGMLGRSALHVAEQSTGLRPCEEREAYLEQAIQYLGQADDSEHLVMALDGLAQLLDEVLKDGMPLTDEREAQMKNRLRECLKQGYALCPEYYEQRTSEEDFIAALQEGYYPNIDTW